ncbi:amidohydrolase family protein [Nocardia sp. NBC_00511]|uniref:amidohydrolase family protein n=1 Tax=Nocardia sp. NBC_00511 TaxID=2903591 RepID=UPI0030E0B2E8
MTSSSTPEGRIALDHVRVFDGLRLTEPTTVVIDGPTIGSDATGARHIDGGGAILLPGLIDAHVHLEDGDVLTRFAEHGVTTALDMGCEPDVVGRLRNTLGATDIRSASRAVAGPDGMHGSFLGETWIIRGAEQAEAVVADRIAQGADYLKLIMEAPGDGGPDADAAKAVVAEAHAHNLLVIAHAASPGGYAMALDAGADVITHVPVGAPLPPHDIARIAAENRVVVPTLVMMEGMAAARGFADAFAAATATIGAMHAAGIPIIAGTDANANPNIPVNPVFGASLHDELALLVASGLSTVDALNSATVVPAKHFGLTDRGVIAPGLRADLVLLDGDPIADIGATRAVTRVWCGGIEHPVAA